MIKKKEDEHKDGIKVMGQIRKWVQKATTESSNTFNKDARIWLGFGGILVLLITAAPRGHL